jgi:hypothetical protein
MERLVAEVAGCPLFAFVKEDEDLYPHLDYSPVAERTRLAAAAIQRSLTQRDGRELLFAPHISGAPHEIVDTVLAVLDAGATAVMFSETFAGGTVRMVREATRACQPAGPVRAQRRHRRQDARRYLARGHRPAGPPGRHRFPADRPRAARRALYPPLWGRMASF